ncbi:RdgB/HAM1 family non-canonical purine NTP pyrophosphatase [Acuticoccus sp. MNP-M23]|uniref:RdgB/HAM1 family non-canonical purine NTP pyrophosphatase n=1 Tax=Acuticoccus sp. MNP-M23 TaxID=3072793 RepID=UPI0028158508|nr:RdgB/HAM1 family non-canonical purine NTP pyrophosphatase [Acuticoccus sp. MNP-M23]WMS43986.1 RdgB/HAM1 family non-canonical purine NTP pyrophosphatase [Acuticoccus sp. MNP-M23]
MTLLEPGTKLILATHNAGKIAEFRDLLEPLGVTVISAGEANLPEPEETETTFEGNARLKADAATRATGLPALADDSGVSVDGLGGDPGIYSARWAGPGKDFAAAMGRVLEKLDEAGHTAPESRRAAFVAVLALARPGEETITIEGRTEGVIAPAPRGGAGFGYDPLFIPDDGDGRTFGEMSAAEKRGAEAPLSHRARAVQRFMAAIRGPRA